MSDNRLELRRAGRKAVEWTERRDALIRASHAAGASLRSIGEDAGLSHTAVGMIVKRTGSTRAAP